MNARRVSDMEGRLSIGGELTIQTVAATRDRLLVAFDMGDELDVDLSGVSEFDSAGAQLLVSAAKYAGGAGKVVRFSGASEAVLELMDFLGLADVLSGRDTMEKCHEPG